MSELAKQFKNTTTVIRDKTGKRLQIGELKESKEQELQRRNKENVSLNYLDETMESWHGSI